MSALQGPDTDESSTLGKLAAALAKAQGAMHAAEKTATNPGFNKKYATLAAVWEACRGPLAENGLAVVQRVGGGGDGRIILTTDLIHAESGEFVRSRWTVPADLEARRNAVQALVSATTYARRTQLAAMVGIAVEDDDGESAGAKGNRRQEAEHRDPHSESGHNPAPSGGGPSNFPNFGKGNGAPIRDAAPPVLEFHLEQARKSLANPDKAKFHVKESALIGALEAELARQRAAAPEGKWETAAGAKTEKTEKAEPQVYEEAARLLKEAPSMERVSAVLRRAFDSQKLNADQRKALDVVAGQRIAALKSPPREPSEGELDAMRYEEPSPDQFPRGGTEPGSDG